jgi:hypothetical protein
MCWADGDRVLHSDGAERAVPPNALREWRYSLVALCGTAIIFFLHPLVKQAPTPLMMVLDAAGLSLIRDGGWGGHGKCAGSCVCRQQSRR